MTTHTPDDELLSAHLDGEADATAHLDTCSDCRARLAALQGVSDAVATATAPLPADALLAAVTRAVDAGTAPVSLATKRRPRFNVLAAAAAVTLVVAVAGAVAVRQGDERSADTTAAAPQREKSFSAAGGGENTVDGGDLGDQRDANVLGERLAADIEASGSGDAGKLSAASDSADESTAAPAGGGRAAESAPTAPLADAGTDARPCLAEARPYVGGDRPLRYSATLRWQGKPALVYVFDVAGANGKLTRRAVVMARRGCEFLVSQSF